jgi:hypothetical protein
MYSNKLIIATAACALVSACASPQMALKRTVTGGDAYPKVLVGPTNELDIDAINVGDTVVFAPGSMRQVVPSPVVEIVLTEDADKTKEEVKKSLQINRREGAKIQVMKGRLMNGDFVQSVIPIDINSADPNKYNVDLVLMAFNRGEKEFRGDLTIYDRPPPELSFLSVDNATKYNDQTATKSALSILPIIQYIAFAMDNYKKTTELVDLQQEVLPNNIHKYTVRRLVLHPAQAVGFTIHLKYQPPSAEEITELRYDAQSFAVQQQ